MNKLFTPRKNLYVANIFFTCMAFISRDWLTSIRYPELISQSANLLGGIVAGSVIVLALAMYIKNDQPPSAPYSLTKDLIALAKIILAALCLCLFGILDTFFIDWSWLSLSGMFFVAILVTADQKVIDAIVIFTSKITISSLLLNLTILTIALILCIIHPIVSLTIAIINFGLPLKWVVLTQTFWNWKTFGWTIILYIVLTVGYNLHIRLWEKYFKPE